MFGRSNNFGELVGARGALAMDSEQELCAGSATKLETVHAQAEFAVGERDRFAA
jgi:hypothetical protein